jgi:hypothetical protein
MVSVFLQRHSEAARQLSTARRAREIGGFPFQHLKAKGNEVGQNRIFVAVLFGERLKFLLERDQPCAVDKGARRGQRAGGRHQPHRLDHADPVLMRSQFGVSWHGVPDIQAPG